jgi:hypothetical protein
LGPDIGARPFRGAVAADSCLAISRQSMGWNLSIPYIIRDERERNATLYIDLFPAYKSNVSFLCEQVYTDCLPITIIVF